TQIGLAASAGDAGAPGPSQDGSYDTHPAIDGDGSMRETPPQVGVLDPGTRLMRPLTNLEYDDTVRDLLGVVAGARATFQGDEITGDFDVIADGKTFNDARTEQYFDSAEAVAAAAFADPTLRARVVTCQPASPQDTTCLRSIVTACGLRAWRRPLAGDEADGLVALATAAEGGGATFEAAIQRVVTALLASAPFLMRMEIDPDPTSVTAHLVTPYELASRLSYLLWSSMPDDQLFARAADGTLTQTAVLTAQVDRMLADPRADGFVDGFAAQWLDAADIATIQFDPDEDLPIDADLRAAMAAEQRLYFGDFLRGDLDFATFLDADFNYVDARLAQHYGMSTAELDDAPVRVVDTTDHRKGFLGTAGFLMVTSDHARTSPTARGDFILRRLFCAAPPPIPAGTPDTLGKTPETGRQVVDSTLAQTSCAACHTTMDEMGLTLEEFDQLGAYRTTYGDGTPLTPADTAGTLRDGTPAADERALADGLAADPGFLACVSQKVMSYAVNRTLDDADAPYASQILTLWKGERATMNALLKTIVVNDTFRFRRGGAP
ncbi:MAG TPA: DUF1592 domain-containing protein, partial [Polyangia bacterium]|nr:DUF1592 domain-containing protein [Polyangia bacterium]